MNILNITEPTYFDNSLVNAEKHSHFPYAATAFNNNDEIRIPIQQADAYTLPSNSYIYIEGQLLKVTDNKVAGANAYLVNNFGAHLFDEIRYEINGKVIDRVRNPGIATTLKGYASFNENTCKLLKNAGWGVDNEGITYSFDDKDKRFNICIPLNILFGFAEDYKKIMVNVKQELVLIRSNSDDNAINNTDPDKVYVKIEKIVWKVPHISVADVERLQLLKVIERETDLTVAFRSWDLNEYPTLPQTKEFTWTIKSTNQLEKPRYILLALQTDKKNKQNANCSTFDHCNISNVKLFLNSEQYPYDYLNLDFSKKKYGILYEMYSQFQKAYYDKENEPLFAPIQFKKVSPLIFIDCSHQNEVLNSGTIDIRLEIEATNNFPTNTSAYCLIIHDRLIQYNTLTGIVKNF